jgi:hypothetical protein
MAAPDPMNRIMTPSRRLAVAIALLLGALALVAPGTSRADEGRAQVRLVRLLEEVPDSERAGLGKVHDLKLRLEPGNILLLRRGNASAAIMPIEVKADGRDSLRYFYYLEHSAFLWVFPGARDKGIGIAGNGGPIHIDTFELTWRADKDGLGWVYFPDGATSRNLRFSVVSGRTVDEADPMDTKYWIELGPTEASGF